MHAPALIVSAADLCRTSGEGAAAVRALSSVITAVTGAGLGVAIGVVFGTLVSWPLGSEGFVLALPYAALVSLLVLGALAGVRAAVLPRARPSASWSSTRSRTSEALSASRRPRPARGGSSRPSGELAAGRGARRE